MPGYDLTYAGSHLDLGHYDDYTQALPAARFHAQSTGRAVVIVNAWDGKPFAVVRPDGSVSAPAQRSSQ